MELIGKSIMLVGAVLLIIGASAYFLGRIGFTGLPGDINIHRDGFRFSFPIVTCIVLSIVVSAILNLLARFRH